MVTVQILCVFCNETINHISQSELASVKIAVKLHNSYYTHMANDNRIHRIHTNSKHDSLLHHFTLSVENIPVGSLPVKSLPVKVFPQSLFCKKN